MLLSLYPRGEAFALKTLTGLFPASCSGERVRLQSRFCLYCTVRHCQGFISSVEATNVIKPSNVIKIDHKCNKTLKCYENHIYLKERRPQLKSVVTLSKKTQYSITFNRKSAALK